MKGVQPFVGEVPNAWREAETQQIAERKNMVGKPCGVCVMFFNRQVRSLIDKAIQDIRDVASRTVELIARVEKGA